LDERPENKGEKMEAAKQPPTPFPHPQKQGLQLWVGQKLISFMEITFQTRRKIVCHKKEQQRGARWRFCRGEFWLLPKQQPAQKHGSQALNNIGGRRGATKTKHPTSPRLSMRNKFHRNNFFRPFLVGRVALYGAFSFALSRDLKQRTKGFALRKEVADLWLRSVA
jgi:hypothetical protein